MPGDRSAIDCLLTPRSVAVVGASPTSYVGRVVIENLQALRFEGPIYPVNPRYDEVLGLPCYPSLDDVPEAPEAVAAAVRIDLVPEVLRSAGARGVRAAIVPGGRFSSSCLSLIFPIATSRPHTDCHRRPCSTVSSRTRIASNAQC